VIAMWKLQPGQTLRLSASSRWKIICPQLSHLVHRFSGMSRRWKNDLILGGS